MSSFPRTPLICVFTFCLLLVSTISLATDYYVSGTTGSAPEVTSANAEPYPLADGDTLKLVVDHGAEQTVQFRASDFVRSAISQAHAAEVAYLLGTRVAGIATLPPQPMEPPCRIRIRSSRTDSAAAIQVTGGTANAKLGFPTEEFSYGDGTQSRPFKTISDALHFIAGTESNMANIRVAAGMYYRENVAMENYVSLWGGYDPATWTRDLAANETVIDGNQRGDIPTLKFEYNTVSVVDGFTIKAGAGGGIVCEASSPTIQNNKIIGGADEYYRGIECLGHSPIFQSPIIQNNIITGIPRGSGISCSGSSPIIQGNIISGNSAAGAWSDDGGAINCGSDSSPLILGNVIIGNEGNTGGGIRCFFNSSPTIRDNIISGNRAMSGGGIYSNHYDSSPTIENNIISGNRASQGGAIYCSDSRSSPNIRNNIIDGNQATMGGGIYANAYVLATIQNNTISGNFAEEGGGIHCYTSSPLVTNNLFVENSNYDVYEGFYQFDQSSDPEAHFNEFYGSTPGIWYDEGTTALATIEEVNALAEAESNVSMSSGFLPSLTGASTSITYDPTTFQSTLTDTSATFSPGALVGLLLNPKTTQPLEFVIVSNTETTITVWGDITTTFFALPLASAGDPYEVFDYHLSSDSTLIDVGTITPVTEDIDGDARPQGAGYDIGADEFRNAPLTAGEGEGEAQPLRPPDSGPELEAELELEGELEPDISDGGEQDLIEQQIPPDERVLAQQEIEPGEGESEEETPAEQEPEESGSPSPTPTPSVLSLCPAARVTASTALAAKLDRLRKWRDEELLATRLGGRLTAAYYRIAD